MEKTYLEDTMGLMSALSMSPSRYHVIKNITTSLSRLGFTELDEREKFSLERGKDYFVTRNSSAVIAFRIPEHFDGYSLISAHTDSPCFKLKMNPEVAKNDCTVLNVEAYGGMLMAPWFDRPLSIAGRAFVKEDGRIMEKLVNFDRDLCQIVNLCIHQNREANTGHAYSVQKELLPIFTESTEKDSFLDTLAEELKCVREDILDYDLYLYNRQKPAMWGKDNEFFSSPHIDDLQCAYTAIRGLIEAERGTKIQLVALFDNEEVGSGTRQGALSDFLQVTLERIGLSLGIDEEERLMMLSNSFMVSADNGHAVHPNYSEKSDIVNRPRMNGGVLIKYSANQKYTTDGLAASQMKDLMDKNDIPWQIFVNNSDVRGGSTLGNLSSQKVSIPTLDCGLAQLAMHSPYETAGSRDTTHLRRFFTAFLER